MARLEQSKISLCILMAMVMAAGRALVADAGETVCPVTADNSIAAFPSEQSINNGRKPSIKIKGREDMPILKFDLSSIPANATVTKAVLSVKLADAKFQINQIGYSTVPTDWVEGQNEKDGKGVSCYRHPGGSIAAWGEEGASVLDVTFGNGGNVTGWVLARRVEGRYEIDLPGRVIEAMRVDQPGGLMLMDESGWWGGPEANMYLRSRESSEAPRLAVTWEGHDTTAPSRPAVTVVPDPWTMAGQLLFEITSGGDDGLKGAALGFDIRILEGARVTDQNWGSATPLPRYLIPRPSEAGGKARLWMKDLKPGKAYSLGVVAYDKGGNRSAIASSALARATDATTPHLVVKPAVLGMGGALTVGKNLQLWATDELTKVDPVSGKVLLGHGFVDHSERSRNQVWDGALHTVVLSGVRGEIVAFRLVMERLGVGALTNLQLSANVFKGGSATIPAERVTLRREWYAKNGANWVVTALPLLSEKDGGRLGIPMSDQTIPGQTIQTVLVELAIPQNTAPGVYNGAIVVKSPEGSGELPIRLKVADVIMPNQLNYIIELNSYGDKNKTQFYAIHRLAHLFRLGYNVVPYNHSGNPTVPYVPEVTNLGPQARVVNWDTWDSWMAPLLDGSLFSDLPRGNTPIPQCYLPFYEGYPASAKREYLGGKLHNALCVIPGKPFNKAEAYTFMCANDVYVADGFSPLWKQSAAAIALEFRRHFEQKKWTRTEFQIFCNNKLFTSKEPSSLWTLDEPSYGRDFRALGFLDGTFKRPFQGSSLNVVIRGDISRPELQGNRLDGCCDISVMSSSLYTFQSMIQRRMHEQGSRYWFYGGAPGPETDLAQLAATYLKTWSLGCDGGLAYWTSFHGNVWDGLDPLACVVEANHGYTSVVVPTDRLAASRRAQQDIELCNLLAQKRGWSRPLVSRAVNELVNLSSKTEATQADDPGRTVFSGVSAEQLAQLRQALIHALETP